MRTGVRGGTASAIVKSSRSLSRMTCGAALAVVANGAAPNAHGGLVVHQFGE